MRFLHTSDWHIGKTLKGQSRLDEQRGVVREIVAVAREHPVDAVLIAGDVYDSAAPSAEAQQLVVQALLALRDTGAEVLVLAGNHDHGPTFDAYRPLMGAVGITVVGSARGPEEGGVRNFLARSSGEPAVVAMLPFLSQRYAIRAAQLVANTPAANSGAYEQMVRDVLASLTGAFRDDAVNIAMAHLTVGTARFGGGERAAQSIFEYHVSAAAFPVEAHYVALGHLHRRQALPAPCPVHYSGAPLQIDFGEEDYSPVVVLVDAAPGMPARTTDVPIRSGRRLRTVRGSLAQLAAVAESADAPDGIGDAFLRVFVREPARARLREEVQQLLPNALEVRIDPEFAAAPASARPRAVHNGERSPEELFHEYLVASNVSDERVERLFARLHDEITGADSVR